MQQVKELEAQGRFAEAADVLKAKLDQLNSRAAAGGRVLAAAAAARR